MAKIKIIPVSKKKIEENLKLKDFLCLVKNKRNMQYSFILKKRALQNSGLSPNKILNMPIPINKSSRKKISKNK